MFTKDWFLNLEAQLKNAGLDSDHQSFDDIKQNLQHRKILSADDFASACIYVILAGGFAQKTAKRKHLEIIAYLENTGLFANQPGLLAVFNNQNKTKAILEIWQKRREISQEYYKLTGLDDKIQFLQNLPHIGKITANHLARNLGENVVKYDVWIQRLGAVFAGQNIMIDNTHLGDEIKKICDQMFDHLEHETGLPRGYIDVVLWKACQNKFIAL